MSEPESSPTLEEINRRLAEIDVLLDDGDSTPSPAQYQLLVERDRLREQASRHWTGRDGSRPESVLRAELDGLKRRLMAELESRTGYVTSKGGGNHSPVPGAWDTLALNPEPAPT